MGRYMTVVLKEKYKNDAFIEKLNMTLVDTYGANNGTKFVTWAHIQEDADFMNNTEEGRAQMKHWPRPITKEILNENFFWYRHGEFSFKISGGGFSSDEARDAVAVGKWIKATKGRYIDKQQAQNYGFAVLRQYLDPVFEEAGYDLKTLWQLPA